MVDVAFDDRCRTDAALAALAVEHRIAPLPHQAVEISCRPARCRPPGLREHHSSRGHRPDPGVEQLEVHGLCPAARLVSASNRIEQTSAADVS